MSPSQIHSNLYVGDIDDVRNGDTSEFDAIVTVCQDDCSDNVNGEYFHFSLRDGPHDSYGRGEFSYDVFKQAADTALARRIRREKILIHCHAGVSRSPTVAIAVLAVLEGLTWDEAFDIAKESRPNINPNGRVAEFGQRYVEEHE